MRSVSLIGLIAGALIGLGAGFLVMLISGSGMGIVLAPAGVVGGGLGFFAGRRFGIPFVCEFYTWSVGIYSGTSPLEMEPVRGTKQPVLSLRGIDDVRAHAVADPFMVRDGGRWYMFVEVLDADSGKGRIGLATSSDTVTWQYEGLVLVEPFHLSYPYVFREDDQWYMIPETGEAGAVRLYQADEFPRCWRHTCDLIEGELLDPSVFQHDGAWYMFAQEGMETLRLYHSEELTGPWREHPCSPVVTDNRHISRPAGRVRNIDGNMARFTQDVYPVYGRSVRAFRIVELTPLSYREVEFCERMVLEPTGRGWNSVGMHHLDPHQLDGGSWIACVDGYGPSIFWGLRP